MTCDLEQTHSIAITEQGTRLAYLDGLRGLAASQVVLRHYLAAFLPGLGLLDSNLIHYKWELVGFGVPWFFVSDGDFWISLFFIISGTVLTVVQERHSLSFVAAVAQRFVRLGGPMVIGLTFAALLLRLAPHSHTQAASLSGSTDWLGALVTKPADLSEILHQVLSSGMVTSYHETSLLPQSVVDQLDLDPIHRSLNPPLWTLHVEVWGSVLVFGLTTLRRRLSRSSHTILVALLAMLLSRHVFLAFMCGHLFAVARTTPSWYAFQASRFGKAAGVAALLLGVIACSHPRWEIMTAWFALPNPLPIEPALNSQGLYAAIVFFSGIVLFAPMRAALLWSPLLWLGRNSFGLYLSHFPILLTASSAAFIALHGRVPYGVATLGATAVGVPLSLLAAAAFTAWVNPPFIRLGRAAARMRFPRAGHAAWTGRTP